MSMDVVSPTFIEVLADNEDLQRREVTTTEHYTYCRHSGRNNSLDSVGIHDPHETRSALLALASTGRDYHGTRIRRRIRVAHMIHVAAPLRCCLFLRRCHGCLKDRLFRSPRAAQNHVACHFIQNWQRQSDAVRWRFGRVGNGSDPTRGFR